MNRSIEDIKDGLAFDDAWLDGNVGLIYREQPLGQDWARISKVQEELGEVTAAYIAYTGQNPRKPQDGTMEQVLLELADVAATALLAIQHFTKDADKTWLVLTARLARLHERIEDIERRKLEVGL